MKPIRCCPLRVHRLHDVKFKLATYAARKTICGKSLDAAGPIVGSVLGMFHGPIAKKRCVFKGNGQKQS